MEKKCVTFWIDENIIKEFDDLYYSRSYFIRECIKRAIYDNDFYIELTTGKKVVQNEKDIL